MTDGIFGLDAVGFGGDVLERFGLDLTAAARRGDLEPVRCRDAEIARCIDILLRQSKNNPALVGAAGVGKTAIAEGLAQRIADGQVPVALRGVRIVSLDHVALLAGTSFRGQYEERVRRLVRAVEEDPDVILFVDELHNLIGQGTAMGAAMDAANMLKPSLVRGDLRMIGATTLGEYDRWVRGDPALERRFQPLTVRELTADETMEVLRARRPRLEHHHAVAIADDALTAARILTDKFVTDRAQPDKSIDVLDEACAHAQASAVLPPELERVVRERRRADAAIRRRLARGERVDRPASAPAGQAGAAGAGDDGREGGEGAEAPDAFERFAREMFPVLERLGEEIERLFGVESVGAPARPAGPAGPGGGAASPRSESLLERRDRLDRELRRGLETLGVVVRGADIARAVGAAVGKRIEWSL